MKAPHPRQLAFVATLAAAVAAASALDAFGDGTPATTAAPAAPRARAEPATAPPRESAAPTRPAAQAREAALAALDTGLIHERQPDAPVLADPFARHSWVVPPPPPPPAPPPPPPAPPPPPQAPALPFTYVGMLEDAPSPTVWYLAVGERLIVAASGETVDGVWRVDGLRDARLLFTYLPLEQRLSLPIGGPP